VNRLDEFFKNYSVDSGGPEEIHGEFYCQLCPGYNSVATYHPDKKIVRWRCSNDHLNEVKEDLG